MRLPSPPPVTETVLLLLRPALRAASDEVLTHAVAAGCNHLLRGQSVADRFAELDGRVIALAVIDEGRTATLRVRGRRVEAAAGAVPAVTIAGTLAALCRLALHREDPDALFFRRELSMSGDTSTGVHVKNLIAAFDFDWDTHWRASLPPLLAAGVIGGGRRLRETGRRLRRAWQAFEDGKAAPAHGRHDDGATGAPRSMPGAPRQ
ncbi:MAG: SCP2 sterol-binding domain-containing protein [Gammaproteobacteria bacterium]|nr:SCP2 sterol-binding domain-containing protein [Gammaproteobacteria bacterium]